MRICLTLCRRKQRGSAWIAPPYIPVLKDGVLRRKRIKKAGAKPAFCLPPIPHAAGGPKIQTCGVGAAIANRRQCGRYSNTLIRALSPPALGSNTAVKRSQVRQSAELA